MQVTFSQAVNAMTKIANIADELGNHNRAQYIDETCAFLLKSAQAVTPLSLTNPAVLEKVREILRENPGMTPEEVMAQASEDALAQDFTEAGMPEQVAEEITNIE